MLISTSWDAARLCNENMNQYGDSDNHHDDNDHCEILRNKHVQTAYTITSFSHLRAPPQIRFLRSILFPKKQARKSSEDAQAAGYAQFEKVWAG